MVADKKKKGACSFCPTVSVHAQFRSQLSQYMLYLDPNCLSTFKVWLQQPYYPCIFSQTISVHALFRSQLSQYVQSLASAALLSLYF